MKKVLLIIAMLFIGFNLTGCDKDLITSRSVLKMNETSKNDYYKADFTKLDGRTVIKIKKIRLMETLILQPV